MDFYHEVQKLLKLKKNEIIQRGIVRIREVDELLLVERRLDDKKLVLKINLTDQKRDGIEPSGYQVIEEV